MVTGASRRAAIDRVIDGIELTAAGFLAAVTVLTFVSVVARYLFSYGILDSYDFSRLLLAVLIFWGIAVASYRSDHITVDILWGSVGPRLKRVLDVFSALVSLFAMAVFTWMMAGKVIDTYRENILTFDLRLPVWIFYGLAWIGLAAAIVLLVVRTVRLLLWPDSLAARESATGIE